MVLGKSTLTHDWTLIKHEANVRRSLPQGGDVEVRNRDDEQDGRSSPHHFQLNFLNCKDRVWAMSGAYYAAITCHCSMPYQ